MVELNDEKQRELLILQQQYQNIIVEIETLKLRNREIEEVLEELQKSDKQEAYKLVGNVLVKKNKEEIINELKEEKEIIDLRFKNLEKQKQKLEEKLNEFRKLLEKKEK
ncbi:MAG: prefoldin subunit [Candidatus Aenigmarchaeota archaeon]|nr:prefoldin subunit [Candidatus Aenigmarchaeota archaeon]